MRLREESHNQGGGGVNWRGGKMLLGVWGEAMGGAMSLARGGWA
jgi:hypothetical protein